MTRGEVHRPPTPGVGAVVVEDGRILLVRRAHGAYAGLWAVPGGRQRFGESMRQAVAREVLEETGLEVDVGEVVWAGDIVEEADPPGWHYTIVDFAATVVGGTLTAGDDAEAVEWVPLDDVERVPLTPTMIELIGVLR